MTGRKEKKPTPLQEQVNHEGMFNFANNDTYQGHYTVSSDAAIVRSGHGEHKSADGTSYKGNWENDKMCGEGVVVFPSGAMYRGNFLNNMMHGYGTYSWPDGSSFEGTFSNNKLIGSGKFIDSDGQIWSGKFDSYSAMNLEFKLET